MRFETYLNAYGKSYSYVRPCLEQNILTFYLEKYNRRLRQYYKFRQRLIDAFYDSWEENDCVKPSYISNIRREEK